MCASISAENNSGKVISIYIDGELFFCDLLPGETSRKKAAPCGTRHVLFNSASGRILADFCISLPPSGHIILKFSKNSS